MDALVPSSADAGRESMPRGWTSLDLSPGRAGGHSRRLLALRADRERDRWANVDSPPDRTDPVGVRLARTGRAGLPRGCGRGAAGRRLQCLEPAQPTRALLGS